jgi:hypothetical protein
VWSGDSGSNLERATLAGWIIWVAQEHTESLEPNKGPKGIILVAKTGLEMQSGERVKMPQGMTRSAGVVQN